MEHSNLLQVEQKRDDSAADKQKHGATRKDRDSIRSAILNEAVIVSYFSLMLKFNQYVIFSIVNFCFIGRSAPPLVSVVQHYSVN